MTAAEQLTWLQGEIDAGRITPQNCAGFGIPTGRFYTICAQLTATSSVTGAYVNKGNINASTNPNYPAAVNGDTYIVTVAGKVGGASGTTVAVGAQVVCKNDNAGGTQASVGTDWFIVPVASSDPAVAIHAATSKTTPVDADEIGITDSAASFGLKKLTWANLKATLKTYFDTLYSTFSGSYTDLTSKPTLGTAAAADTGAFATAAQGTDARTPTAHASTHASGGTDAIKLDELAAPTDVTTLNATTSAHGLLPKLGGGTTNFLRADGSWAAPAGGVSTDDTRLVAFAADAGSNDTYVATLSPAPSVYTTGAHYRFKANTANTGAATINFNGLGAKTIVKAAGGITTALADNDIRSGQWVDVVYDGVNMQMQSTLGNAGGGLSAPTLAGINSITSATGQALTLATLDSNANLALAPNGTGKVLIGPAGIKIGDATNGPTIAATGTSPNESLVLTSAGTGAIVIPGEVRFKTPNKKIYFSDGLASGGYIENFDTTNGSVTLSGGNNAVFITPALTCLNIFSFQDAAIGPIANNSSLTLRSSGTAAIILSSASGITQFGGTNGPKISVSGTSPNENLNLNPSPAGTGVVTVGSPFRLKGYTVGTLPTGSVGDTAYVTDAMAPVALAAVVGGGAVVVKVFYNGANWIVQ
jgi:hypothetical protein